MLRFFGKQACDEALPEDEASDHALFRARPKLALVLRGSKGSLSENAAGNPVQNSHTTRQENDMAIEWKKDVDAALAEAKTSGKPLLLDFTAAPA